MRLYHGGSVAVPHPQPVSPERNRPLDFGSGFYTTTSLEQARRWIGIRRRQDASFGKGVISEFEVDDAALAGSGLKIKRFSSSNLDPWFDFVMANRHVRGFAHSYDVVIGPVANDKVFTTLTLYETGVLDKMQAILQLKTYVLWDQYLFHTEASLQYLRYLGTVR
jgi:hypothetical protein